MKKLPLYLRLVKGSATVLFWLVLLGVGLVIVRTIKFDDATSFTISLPTITLTGTPARVVKEAGRQIAIDTKSTGVNLSYYYPEPGRFRRDIGQYVGQVLVPTILLFMLALIGLWQVKRIFDTLGTPDVFSLANVRRIRIIASPLIAGQLLPGLIWLFMQTDILALLDRHHIAYRVNHEIKILSLFTTAVLLFRLAEVFRSGGVQLKQENELTIWPSCQLL